MKKIFNVYNIALILVVALIGVLTLKTTEVKATGTVTWTNGSTATISRTVQNVYNAPEVDFTYSVSTEDTSLLKTATFDTGPVVNQKTKVACGDYSNVYDGKGGVWYKDQVIHAIKKGSTLPSGFVPSAANTISTATSDYPIYIWWDITTSTIYYYSEADILYLNSDSSRLFATSLALEDISDLIYLDASKATNIDSMFYACKNVSGTIQILGNPTTYDGAFTGAATASGTEITVNYGSGTTNIDNIIATKSSTSNVVKGSQVSAPSEKDFYTKDLSFAGSETVSNTYTVNKTTTINLANLGLNFTKPGNYTLKVKETGTSNSAYPVDDDNEYTIIIQITNAVDANNIPTGNFNAAFVIKDDNDTKQNSMAFSEPKDESKFGYIEVSKTVKGIMADRTESFEFSIEVDDAASSACGSYSGSEKYLIKGTGVSEDGSEVTKCKSGTKDTIHLTHGQSATIGRFTYNNSNYNSISIDDYYKITETLKSGYTTSFKVGSGSETSSNDMSITAVSNGANSVTFYNQKEGNPLTGLFLTIFPYLILIGLGVVGISLYKKDWSQLLIKMRGK